MRRRSPSASGGAFVARWGGPGYRDAEFWKPAAIAPAPDGRLFVVDYGNHRAQIFSPEGEWLVTFGTGRAYTKWDRRPSPPVRKPKGDD